MHINALYDVCNNIYVGACVQGGRKKNECRALCEMDDASEIKGPAIVLGDRSYECFNNFTASSAQGCLAIFFRACWLP